MRLDRSPSWLGGAIVGIGFALVLSPFAVGSAFAACPSHTAGPAARPTSGPLIAWGANPSGQLGDGTTMDKGFAEPVNLPKGFRATSARTSARFSVAIDPSGQVWAWGDGTSGDLGNGLTKNRLRPVKVHLPKGVKIKAVRAGFDFAVAATTDGRVIAWGDGILGELGNGHRRNSDLPVFVALPRGVKVSTVSAGAISAYALTTTGRVLAWGADSAGELGDGGGHAKSKPVFVKIPQSTKITAVGAGVGHMFAVTSTGSLLAWGSNSAFDLGTGKPGVGLVPVPVTLPKHVKVVAAFAGLLFSLALTRDGRVLAWGDNEGGQLGDGTLKNRKVPVFAKIPKGTKITSLAAGRGFSLALTAAGKIFAWGDDDHGQLGDGGNQARKTPFQISVPGKVISIGAGCEAFTSFAVVTKIVD